MKLMGILNVTPDSFSDGGNYDSIERAVQRALQMEQQGADILDIGGESSRPGASPISIEEELNRILPVIQSLKSQLKIPISVDTMKPIVAQKAINEGVSIINDITGCQDPLMQEIIASSGIPICIMHMQGNPQTMQLNPHYEGDIIDQLIKWFSDRMELLIKAGIKEKQFILDPGIGFGKTVADNVKILQNLPKLKSLGFPLLLGVSRKSFIQKILNKPATETLAATLVVNTLAFQGEVDIIRVHDVVEHRDLITLMDYSKIMDNK